MSIRDMPRWTVNWYINGQIKVENELRLFQGNGDNSMYDGGDLYRNIIIGNDSSGVEITADIFSNDLNSANKAALLYIGQMLDVLSFSTKLPLSLNRNKISEDSNHSVCRILDNEEWRSAFKLSYTMSDKDPYLLKSLGWFRKGFISENPFDKFLALWNSIEILTDKFKPALEEGRKPGSKNHMWATFIDLWGECIKWPIIDGDEEWIDNFYDQRVAIAHGLINPHIEDIEKILKMNDELQDFSHSFIYYFSKTKKHYNLSPETLLSYTDTWGHGQGYSPEEIEEKRQQRIPNAL